MQQLIQVGNNGDWPLAGTVVWTPAYVVYRHKGVISDRWQNGKPMVISNSARRGGVCEDPWDEFCQGNPVFRDGYPGSLASHEVIWRAREKIGTRYDIFKWNCDSFVRHAHGLDATSLQLALTVVALLAIGAAVIARAR